MVARSGLSPSMRLGLAAAVVLVLVLVAPGVRRAWQGNWTEIALTQAAFADAPGIVFERSGAAIGGYVAAGDEAPERLLRAYQMRWRSAAQIGNLDEGLAAFAAGHHLTTDGAGATVCTASPGELLEAEDFAGVQPGTLAIPAEVSGRGAVLLFSAEPISQSVCLQTADVYTIAVTAAVSGPPPVEVAVNWDGWPVGALSYEQEDGSLSETAVRIVAPAGAHTLTLTFANDFSDPVTGVDRNAVIESVRMIRGMATDERRD